MSESRFRAVIAAVLVAALVLASVVALAVLQRASPNPSPGPTATSRPSPTPLSTPAPAPTPSVVFRDVTVTAVGSVPRGAASATTLVLRFVEPSIAAIPDRAGSFTVTLTDQAGSGATVAFTGTPSIDAPGSLGATAQLLSANALEISIAASDLANVEPITVTGLGIRASSEAALGSINATLGDFSGSLAGGVANHVLATPGTIIAGP
jgi:hypothetical protein